MNYICSYLVTEHQTGDLSWFPTNIWNTSGYNKGYWSWAAEEWYQDRLQEIACSPGTALLTGNGWRKKLKGAYSRTRPLRNQMQASTVPTLQSIHNINERKNKRN